MQRLILAFLIAPLALAQEAPKTAVAERGTVRSTLDRTGTLLPADATELKLDLKVYRGSLELKEVLPHASFVNEGDVIARLDTEAIDEQIVRERMALERAEMGMRHTEESAAMDAEKEAEALERAEIDAARSAKRLRGFREHERAFEDESKRLNEQARQHRLEDQKDELDQLEKMYAEDELVDATEEIVLKRSRRNYARSVASSDLAEARRKYSEDWYEAWREEDLERDARAKEANLARVRASQAMARERREADLVQKRFDLEKQRERFADLEKDRAQFVVRAPHGGILLHGPVDAAPWGRLERGAGLKSGQVFASVAKGKLFQAKTNIAEADILKLKANVAAEVVPTAAEDLELVGAIEVDYLPGKGGNFDAVVKLPETPDVRLRPGFSCKVHVILEQERDAVLVPVGAVTEKDGKHYVQCSATAEGPFEEREVVVGVSDGKLIAIRDGVAEGEFVALKGK